MLMRILAIAASLMMPLAFAGDSLLGKRLADLSILDRGELVLAGDEVTYQPWRYPQEPGRVHVVQYLAATQAASEINEAFTDRMKTDLPQGQFLSTTIVNLDEAMWGTGGFVVSKLKSNKLQFPGAVLVADADGLGRKQWQLEKKSSAVIVADPSGLVRFFKQGAMSAEEIESTLAMVKNYIVGAEIPPAP